MAGRDLPGHQESDSRWLVDRQVYERRRDGVRYVTWSRSRQLGWVWLVALLIVLAMGAGAASVLAWQRLAPDLVALLPAELRSAISPWISRDATTAPATAMAGRDAPRPEPAAATAVVDPSTPGGVGFELEMTLLRHERDAARQQIDALMQLTAQLKSELAVMPASGRSGADTGADGLRLDQLEAELAAAQRAVGGVTAERDEALGKLEEAERAIVGLQTSYDRLAGRAADAEQALVDTRQAGEAAQSALADVRSAALAESLSGQQAIARLQDELRARLETLRTIESESAALRAKQASLEAELTRVGTERDQAVQAERMGREERDSLTAQLRSIDGQRAIGDPQLLRAERDQLAARVGELQANLDDARTAADETGRRLAESQGELGGASRDAETLHRALDDARAELAQKDRLLSGVPALQARLAIAEAKISVIERPAAFPEPAADVVPTAMWTIVEDAAEADDGSLRQELATALARIKELAARASASEQRTADLERFVGDRAPPPPPVAPR